MADLDAVLTPPPAKVPTVTQVSRPFFTPAELSYLHSISIPDHKKIAYSQRKHQIFQYVFQIVKALKFPLRVLSTTMNYYQRFYLFNKFEEMTDDDNGSDLEKDPYTVALTCLFLATKNEDCIKKLKDIQAVANRIRDYELDKALSPSFVDLQRKNIMLLEFKLLQVLKFDFINGTKSFSVDTLLVQFAKKLGLDYKSSMYAWLISFDLMSTPLGLTIPPHCIALAIIIITLNLKPHDLQNKYNQITVDEAAEDDHLGDILERIDSLGDFRCPETLVNEGIIYILDFYIHQMNFSILNDYMPLVDPRTGKEQIFKFMNLKSNFHDLKILNEQSCAKPLLQKDAYLRRWDFSVGAKGAARFMLSNKRRRFDKEYDVIGANALEKKPPAPQKA